MNPRDLARQLRNAPPLNDPRALCAALDLGVDPRDRQRQGAGLTVRCPRHGGVSCSVTHGPDHTVRIHCFGCDFSGDALDLVAEVRGLDRVLFREVLREAAALAGSAPNVQVDRPTRPPGARGNAPTLPEETYNGVAQALLDHCSPLPEVAPDVARYLDARGIYADADADGVRGLPHDARPIVAGLLGTFERAHLEQAGVLRRGFDALDWPAWRLLVPWRNRYGRITCLQRRRLDAGRPKYRVPSGRAPSAPFGVDVLAAALEVLGPQAEVVVTEGALDALVRRRIARHRGERAAVLGVFSASRPCEGLPLDLLAGRRVVLALDTDEAGERASAVLGDALRAVAGEFVRERPVGAKDWGAALAKVGT